MMQKAGLRLVSMALLVMLIAGCDRPQTPEEVTQTFWSAVIEGDAKAVAEWSTLKEPDQFAGFERDWTDVEPTFGRIVIEGDEAIVSTYLSPPAKSDAMGVVETDTYLVRRDDTWIVDYQRTRRAFEAPSPIEELISQANRLGDTLSEQFRRSAEELRQQMEQLSKRLDDLSQQAEQRTQQAVEDYSEALQQYIKELRQSIEQALENNQQAPKEERQALQTTVSELKQRSKELEEATTTAIVKTSQTLSDAKERLSKVDSESFESYRQQWNEQFEAIQARTRAFFDQLRQSLSSQGQG